MDEFQNEVLFFVNNGRIYVLKIMIIYGKLYIWWGNFMEHYCIQSNLYIWKG